MAKAIMIQGTMSNAGKSLVAAGLCRIFHQDGYRVAPFKSQNMALNSYITDEGLEMGRAQVMQAEAAGIRPCVDMNPILLKPTNDVGSQVIVGGKAIGNMSAREYFGYKKQLIPQIMEAYHRLDNAYDIIVIEGAGSPAEINLKSEDIVNMGMAKLAESPVLLVGDIDRGGVFAQLVGTVMLLEEEEQSMIKGLIINKFRGDKSILDPGVAMLEERCGIPVVGVTPYLQVELEDEDSLTDRFSRSTPKALIDLAVIRLPRISNFTDFNPFEQKEGVSLRYVQREQELGSPDMILIPGTKNTIDDLRWMRQNGLEAAIKKRQAKGTLIWGICGGYQMLGEWLDDPWNTEGGGSISGMGLLPMKTTFAREKTTTRVRGGFETMEGVFAKLSGAALEGYEIHMGESVMTGKASTVTRLWEQKKQQDGSVQDREAMQKSGACSQKSVWGDCMQEHVCKADGLYREAVLGTYVHGIFDRAEVVDGVLESIALKKGIDWKSEKTQDYAAFKETQYDMLAEGLRKHLDMDAIYRILEEGV